VAAEVRANIAARRTPPPVATLACRRCSLQSVCLPERMQKPPSVARWLTAQIEE